MLITKTKTMKRFLSTTGIVIALVLLLTVSSCKNDPEVKIPLIEYILIDDYYTEVKGLVNEHTDSMAMKYNSSNQLVSIIGYFTQYDLTYDGSGRLIKAEVVDNRGKADYSYYIDFTWSGNTVTAQQYYYPSTPLYYKTVMTFNSNDQMIKMEYFVEPQKAALWILDGYNDYTWTSSNITKMESYYNYTKSARTYSGPGFSKRAVIEPTTEDLGKGQLAATLNAEVDLTFDNKTNPFANYPGLGILFADEMPHIFLSKNNPLRATYSEYYDGTYTYNVDFSYEFNDQGFPIEIVQNEDHDTYAYNETWTIKYK